MAIEETAQPRVVEPSLLSQPLPVAPLTLKRAPDDDGEAVLHEVIKVAMDDQAVIPLFHLINTWATRRGLNYEARMDEGTRAMAARAAP